MSQIHIFKGNGKLAQNGLEKGKCLSSECSSFAKAKAKVRFA